VKSLSILKSSGVEVVMDIESKIKQNIRKDSKVKLGSDGLIGNRILIIYGGTPDMNTIEDGDTLMYEKTLAADDLLSTLQKSNENLEAITSDFKIISRKLVDGEGTVGKLLSDNSLYTNISSAVSSLQGASTKAAQLMNSLADFSSGLQKEGTLAHELTSDTVVFNSIRASFLKIGHMADTASLLINNLKEAAGDRKSSVGLLLNDENTGAELKRTITNLEQSTEKLNIDLQALQHSFLLKGYFKHKADSAKQK
jgi:phospholipid/cholesterol/gamma-HCH transport system substrate-binding protein